MTKFAAIGTDGTRAVVWGLGATEEAAEADAAEQEGAPSDLVLVSVSTGRASAIEAGNVDAEDLVEADGRGGIRARATTHSYSIRTDAGSMDITAENADAAASRYSGGKHATLDALVAYYESIEGAWLMVSEDDIDLVRAGDLPR